jgi:nucleotide-binding universal stress UspA family protein
LRAAPAKLQPPAAHDDAQRLAEHGAALAREAGLQADGLAVADDVTVADTLVRLAREFDAQAVVAGAHDHRGLRRLVPGRTLAGLLREAPCPVVVWAWRSRLVARASPAAGRAEGAGTPGPGRQGRRDPAR